jgi:hypothetical protein
MSDRTTRPGADEYAPFYANYIAGLDDGDVIAHMRAEGEATRALLSSAGDDRADHAYAPGKWTVREVAGHLCDAERVMAYRALRFARGDRTELAGFDENAYVPESGHATRSLDNLVAELAAIREASIALFDNLPDVAWTRTGVANGNGVSVRALAWIIAGHDRHHRGILESRYGLG